MREEAGKNKGWTEKKKGTDVAILLVSVQKDFSVELLCSGNRSLFKGKTCSGR